MPHFPRSFRLIQRSTWLLTLLASLTGCAALGGKTDEAAPASAASAASAPARKPAAASRPAAVRPTTPPPPVPSAPGASGLNDRGEVVDSGKLSAGSGVKVKGRGGWDGEISGKPAAGSRFAKLEIGMTLQEVTDQLGPPSDQGSYATSKAFIPFYFGADRHRTELVYKGQGRLVFAGGSVTDSGNHHLVWIIHNANEPATRR